MRFTVFTPAYNRAYCIEQLYRSLQRQTFRDFEWIVIDDGSKDNTEEVVAGFLAEQNFFPIRYQKVPNGGKHRAFNLAVRMAEGEMFTCVDSDDYLTDDALEVADAVEKSIPEEEKQFFAGVCGQKGNPDLSPLKNSFNEPEYQDLTYLERIDRKCFGDGAESFYTEVLRRYPFVEYEGENFLTEATVLFEMARNGLKTRFFSKVIKIIEYLPDGLTANSEKRFVENPKGWGLYIYQRIENGLLQGFGKWEVIAKYFYACRARLSIREMAKTLHLRPTAFFLRIVGLRLVYRLYR